ncbi:helix-turn-helix domain-containing protein [Brevibacillus humidisoli]|uniref:helix-turn-helix domain-containing protein n=1 Tax=Brevibacillus humidisoli TaxID=2895522 RepID=UPI001E2BDC6A|nr:helix-turn-helix transcriptional regulator [Brevibacillus humidisoli]UFJ42027.1 helix-turn-helix domain-containing protein [Brevibacillus humidisoli]
MSTFGERVAKLRTEKKMSQAELASHLQLAKSTLAMYETDKREPGFETIQRIADFFQVTTDYLLLGRESTRSEEMSPRNQLEHIFFYELDKLSDEDKHKALEHIKYLRYLAEKEQNQK